MGGVVRPHSGCTMKSAEGCASRASTTNDTRVGEFEHQTLTLPWPRRCIRKWLRPLGVILFRGRGVGRALLAALEDEARSLGAKRLVLETGERMREAVALYERTGFTVIPPFGEYVGAPLSLCMAKELRREASSTPRLAIAPIITTARTTPLPATNPKRRNWH